MPNSENIKNKKFIESFAEETHGDFYATRRYILDNQANESTIDSNEEKIPVDIHGETIQIDKSKNLKPELDRVFNQGPLFRYFLDGSRKTYKIGDISYNNRPYPIICGQIAVACVERVSPSKFKCRRDTSHKKTILSVPSTSVAEEDLELTRQTLLKKSNFKYDFTIDHIFTYDGRPQTDENKPYENRAIARIQEVMIDTEKAIVIQLSKQNLLSENKYLIKDGSLEYSNRGRGKYVDLWKIKDFYKSVVGVSKNFNPEALASNRKYRKIADNIASLPLFHRTPAFQYQSKHTDEQIYFSVWYLRIRDRYSKFSSPFDGVIKVEKILVTEDEMDNGLITDEVDLISTNLLIERNPTTFGKESRWHSHLYPIYVTESYVKSMFHSSSFFMNSI